MNKLIDKYLDEGYYRGGKKAKQAKRTKFNADVQDMVKKLGGHGGKVDWDTVAHLFNTGKDVEYTAKRIVDIQKGK